MIEWTEPAIGQLNQSYDYIASTNNEAVAANVVERIVEAVQRLSLFPLSGRLGPGGGDARTRGSRSALRNCLRCQRASNPHSGCVPRSTAMAGFVLDWRAQGVQEAATRLSEMHGALNRGTCQRERMTNVS